MAEEVSNLNEPSSSSSSSSSVACPTDDRPRKRPKLEEGPLAEDLSAPAPAPPPTPADGPPSSGAAADDGEAVAAECAALRAEFGRVKRNRVVCLTFLVKLAQGIEQHWEARERRLAKLALLRECLGALHNSIHRDLKELSWLAEKMKDLDLPLKHFLVLFLPIERKHTRSLRDDEFLIQTTDAVTPGVGQQRFPFVVVLDNLRSAFNVGSIFRSAECLGASRIYVCGYTAPPSEGQTQKATMGAEAFIPWEAHSDVREVLQALRAAGTAVVALETVAEAPLLSRFSFPPPTTTGGCALLVGNERHGLEAPVLALCDHVVRIPSFGMKNSLNVAVAFGIASFELVRQWTAPTDPSPTPDRPEPIASHQ
eukprot:EG_transcript_12973